MSESFQRLARACDGIAGTTKKLQKTAVVSELLKSLPMEQAAATALFLSGRPFPVWEETTLQLGGRALWQIVAELSGKEEGALTTAYRKYGDLGSVAQSVLPERQSGGLDVLEVQRAFRQIAAARGPAAKGAVLRDLLSRATPLEAKYIIKIITGDLRIGLKESLVEEAIAKAYGIPAADGQIVAWEFTEKPEAAKAIVDQASSDHANLEAGENKATEMGHARPFTVLQQRLGRKKVSDAMLRAAPVAYLVFDVLYASGELLI